MTSVTIDEALELYSDQYGDGSDGGAVRWCEDFMESIFWSKQIEIMNSVFENERTCVKACHESSKTVTAADIILAFMFICYPAKVITTAPTWNQVRDLLWSDIRRKYDMHLAKHLPGIECHQMRLEIEPDYFAVGLSPKETVSLTGHHQANVLVVFDEAPGVSIEKNLAAETLMSGGNPHWLKIGNPTASSGHFYNNFRDSQWNPISIGYEDTPNFTHLQDDPDPRDVNLPQRIKDQLISVKWVDGRRERWGEDSPLFISRCKGDFPPEGEQQVISLSLCEAAAARDVLPEGDIHLGVDVARFGDDLTVLTPRRGNVILEQEVMSGRDTMEVTGRIGVLHYRDGYATINVDVIGVGAGVVDRGQERGLPVVAWDVRQSPDNPKLYFNKRTEAWFHFAEWLKYGKIPYDLELFADLTAPQYTYTSDGKYRVESKEETKRRLGRSPDYADSAIASIQSAQSGAGAW